MADIGGSPQAVAAEMAFATPRLWTEYELRAERERAEELFRVERRSEGPIVFERRYRDVEPGVRDALKRTDNLRSVIPSLFEKDDKLWRILRYFCAPPISEEDLWTLVGRKFKRVPSGREEATAIAIRTTLDRVRFPWVQESRTPSARELESAVMATTQLIAYESLRTERRGKSAKTQEGQVSDLLADVGFTRDLGRSPIITLDKLARASFSPERKLGGAKCDVPIRLNDGRLLALECKVSNGPKNSWKRLHREVGGKAQRWTREFGNQVITGAVLAGVYDLSCLAKAQDEQGVYLFWQQDLSPLRAFLLAAQA